MFIVVTETNHFLISSRKTLLRVFLSLQIELMICNCMMCTITRILNKESGLGMTKNFTFLKKKFLFSRFDEWCVEQLLQTNDVRIDFGMGVVKELIVKFSAESIVDVPKEGAIKAFEKVGFAACFTREFQEKAELLRAELKNTVEFDIINDSGFFPKICYFYFFYSPFVFPTILSFFRLN